MKHYFYLQIKKCAKILPFITALTLVLLVGLAAILYGVMRSPVITESSARLSIAVAGDTQNGYLQMGIMAMQTMDDSRFAVDFQEMTESEAKTALQTGKISAYIVVPEKFVENIMSGELHPITFVTTTGMEDVNSLLKKEITTLITDMMVYSQKGVYGVADVYSAADLSGAGKEMERISIAFADLVFDRSAFYEVDEVGVAGGLSIPQYYICAIFMLLLVLIGMPFALMHIKRDYALNRLLVARGYSAGRQILWEYLAHASAMLLQTAMVMAVVFFAVQKIPTLAGQGETNRLLLTLSLKALPVLIVLAAFNIFMFELADHMVSGLLLYFFTAMSLCYVSGCMYPVYAFPDGIKALSALLPIGIARGYLSTAFTGESDLIGLLCLLVYGLAFLGLAWFVRHRKTVEVRG